MPETLVERAFYLTDQQLASLEKYRSNHLHRHFSSDQIESLLALKQQVEQIFHLPSTEMADKKNQLFREVANFIYTIEGNGDPQEHATKLAKLFPSLPAYILLFRHLFKRPK